MRQTWDTLLDPAMVSELQFHWSVQKNLDNGETMSQEWNFDTMLYLVQAALRIREHAQRINAKETSTMEIFAKCNKRSFITKKHITIHLQSMATATHGVTSKK